MTEVRNPCTELSPDLEPPAHAPDDFKERVWPNNTTRKRKETPDPLQVLFLHGSKDDLPEEVDSCSHQTNGDDQSPLHKWLCHLPDDPENNTGVVSNNLCGGLTVCLSR
jgi:hypothetical protein